jgi:hypothetical protein
LRYISNFVIKDEAPMATNETYVSGRLYPINPSELLPDPVAAVEISQKTVMKIGNIDTTAWTDEERESFRVTLVELRDKIDSFLSPGPALA